MRPSTTDGTIISLLVLISCEHTGRSASGWDMKIPKLKALLADFKQEMLVRVRDNLTYLPTVAYLRISLDHL